jgi:hypothetical protein
VSFGWVLNLDAELELAEPSFNPGARLSAQLERYGAGAHALFGPNDVLLRPGLENSGALTGRAWCPTPRALAAMAAAGVEPEPHPTLEVLRRVNHRHFAFELGDGLPDQDFVVDRAKLEAIFADPRRAWLLKRPLAFAGRGQLRVYRELSESEWSWIDASLKRDGMIVEPLVVPALELSQHGFVWPDGRYELGRPCVQEVSERGVFRAVRLAAPGELTSDERNTLHESSERVAQALASAGYFGPFGIDAYRYELDGRSAFCGLSEINARYTMGFATGFPRPACDLVLD